MRTIKNNTDNDGNIALCTNIHQCWKQYETQRKYDELVHSRSKTIYRAKYAERGTWSVTDEGAVTFREVVRLTIETRPVSTEWGIPPASMSSNRIWGNVELHVCTTCYRTSVMEPAPNPSNREGANSSKGAHLSLLRQWIDQRSGRSSSWTRFQRNDDDDDEDDGRDGTNSLRIPLASSMLFLASFRARRAFTSSKPSATSRPRLWSSAVAPPGAESALDEDVTGGWWRAGRGGTAPSGRLMLWPADASSFDAVLQTQKQ